MVVLMIAKSNPGKWGCVTLAERIKKDESASKMKPKSDDPNQGMMDLMKEMYDQGDDDMKRVSKFYFKLTNILL